MRAKKVFSDLRYVLTATAVWVSDNWMNISTLAIYIVFFCWITFVSFHALLQISPQALFFGFQNKEVKTSIPSITVEHRKKNKVKDTSQEKKKQQELQPTAAIWATGIPAAILIKPTSKTVMGEPSRFDNVACYVSMIFRLRGGLLFWFHFRSFAQCRVRWSACLPRCGVKQTRDEAAVFWATTIIFFQQQNRRSQQVWIACWLKSSLFTKYWAFFNQQSRISCDNPALHTGIRWAAMEYSFSSLGTLHSDWRFVGKGVNQELGNAPGATRRKQ